MPFCSTNRATTAMIGWSSSFSVVRRTSSLRQISFPLRSL